MLINNDKLVINIRKEHIVYSSNNNILLEEKDNNMFT